MTRLFLAIVPPDDVKRAIVDARGELDGARFVREDQIHLTLKFIGAHSADRVDDLVNRTAEIVHPSFDLSLSQWGRFGHPPRVLWIGVTPHEPVRSLATKIEETLEVIGVSRTDRELTPHLTVARLKRTAPIKVRTYLEARAANPPLHWPVRSFRLYESRLSSAGPTYTCLADVQLVRS